MRRFVFASALIALAAPGCTLITNPNQYVGNGGVDSGMPTDTGPRPDTTVDSAVDTGPHVNSPPVLTSVGLDNYRPMAGETVHGLAGRVYDVDGDPTSVHFEWFVNGTLRTGATTATLDTTPLSAGDHLHVEAWANDGMVDGPRVATSDVDVLESVTRWRQLLPSEDSGTLPQFVWDAPHQRAVRLVDGGIWEYVIESTRMRVSQLPTAGPFPPADDDTIVLFDEGRRRMIVAAGGDPSNIFTLDVSSRGGGAWMHTPVTGTSPPSFFLTTSFYESTTHRIFVLGGKDDTLGALYGLTTLDVTSAGGESWATITPSGATLPTLFGSCVAPDATHAGRYYLIGGMTSTVGSGAVDPVYSGIPHVIQIDVSATDVHLTELSADQPPSFGNVCATDPTTGHVVVYGGFTVFGPGASMASPQVFDPATGAFTPIGGTLPHGAIFGAIAPSPTSPGHFGAFTIGADLSGLNGPVLQFDDLTESAVTPVVTRTGPRTVSDASARLYGTSLQVVGGDDNGTAAMSSWALDTATLDWSVFAPAADPATSHTPDLRYGVRVDNSPYGSSQGLFQVGGARASGVLADMVVFEIDNNGRWLEHTATGTPPSQRVGALVLPGHCGQTTMVIYGGEDPSGNVLGDGGSLECPGDHTCMWSAIGPFDGGRSYAASFSITSDTWVFGGRTTSGPMNDVFNISDCATGPQIPGPLATTGLPPSPRYGHSFTQMQDSTGVYTFGVVFGGTDGTTSFNDVFTMTPGPSGGTWVTITPAGTEQPAPRTYHSAVPDIAAHRVLIVGGDVTRGFGTYSASDVWELVLRP